MNLLPRKLFLSPKAGSGLDDDDDDEDFACDSMTNKIVSFFRMLYFRINLSCC